MSVTSALVRQTFPNLLIERLYYAEGRQHPSHPLHGSYAGLCRS
ncbi:cyanate hydratase [Synechococcus sp. MVIR-18-1]|nr:cyanate hydratase [Synechococcus sp. MVIR-18-1]